MTEALDMNGYLARVHDALEGVPAGERDEAVAELEANLLADIVRRGGNDAAEMAAIADLGEPEEYAAQVRETIGDAAVLPQPQGHIFGMPYEFRSPTASRVMERMWNPSDPRIMMPRSWGVGWTINFGAIAVRLGLVRPDDVEERPFENLSDAALRAAMTVPIVLGLAAAALAAAFWTRLPGQVPVHFNGAGAADDWASKPFVIGLLVGVALVLPLLSFAWRTLRGASRGTIAVTSTMLSLFSLLATVILGYTIANAVFGVEGWWILLLILGSLLLPATMFYLLARASLQKEWSAAPGAATTRRDL